MDQVTITLSKQDPGQLRSAPDHIECPGSLAPFERQPIRFRSSPRNEHRQAGSVGPDRANERHHSITLSALARCRHSEPKHQYRPI